MNFLQRIWADKLTFLLLRNEQGDESLDLESEHRSCRTHR